jgi:glutathione S-transferase
MLGAALGRERRLFVARRLSRVLAQSQASGARRDKEMFTLYTTPLSANGRKALAVSHHLGLAPAIKLVNVYKGEGRTPEYLAINPSGKIPTLVDGDFILSESNAIVQYMSEAYGNCRLWSRDAQRRADIARWLFWESSHWQPAFIPALAAFVGQLLLPQTAPAAPVDVDWSNEPLQAQLTFLDAHLRGRQFIVGNELTLADFCVGAMMMYVRPAKFPFAAFQNIGAWYGRIESAEAWRATAAGPWVY